MKLIKVICTVLLLNALSSNCSFAQDIVGNYVLGFAKISKPTAGPKPDSPANASVIINVISGHGFTYSGPLGTTWTITYIIHNGVTGATSNSVPYSQAVTITVVSNLEQTFNIIPSYSSDNSIGLVPLGLNTYTVWARTKLNGTVSGSDSVNFTITGTTAGGGPDN